MSEQLVTEICWVVLALLHLPPALALARPSLIGRLYALEPESTAFLLTRHRAALFCGVSMACVWAVLVPGVRPLAAAITGLSMVSFLLLYRAGGSPAALRSIAVADAAALPALGWAAWAAVHGG